MKIREQTLHANDDDKLQKLFTSATFSSGLRCPRCNGTHYIKNGKLRQIQQYRCRDCGRSFGETVNTAMHWLHNKHLIDNYITTMEQGKSIRKSALVVGISVTAAFRWRHRLLASLSEAQPSQSARPAEIREINMPHSYKGRRTKLPESPAAEAKSILIVDIDGRSQIHLLGSSRRAKETAKLIQQSVPVGTPLAFSNSPVIAKASRSISAEKTTHRLLTAALAVTGKRTETSIAEWMFVFRGVATKYLQQYWAWYGVISQRNAGALRQECLGHRPFRKFMAYMALP